MRYKEFATSESIDRFMGHLLGNPSIGDVASNITNVSKDDPDQSEPSTSTNVSTDSGGKPVAGGRISDTFGSRGGAHNGVDIAVPIGTPVQSPLSGVVSRTGSDNLNGNFVVVKSGNEENFFLHLSQIKVSNGQQIKKGDVVGLSGNTGKSTGPHLHWEKHISGRPVNPMSNIG